MGLLQKRACIADVGGKLPGLHLAPFQQGVIAHGLLMIAARQLHVLGVQDHVQTVLHPLFIQMQQIAQTQGLLAVFVAVGIGDAAAGGAEGGALFGKAVFFQLVLHLVPRHGDGGLIRELEVLGAHLHAALLDGVHLARQMVQVDDHARAQHTDNVRVQDAGGQQVQDELALRGDDGVPGVVATLIAGHHIGVFRQQVDDAALAFIAPIDTSNCGQHILLYLLF